MTYTPVFSVHGTRHSLYFFFFFFNDTATTEIYPLSLPDALPIYRELIGPAFPAAAQRLTQPLGCRNQDFVADAVAEGVIDALEIVQIDIHERQQASRLRIGERCAQMAVRLFAIRQPCQRIAIGEPHDVLHHTVELARQDRDFIRPLEIEPGCRIRAFTDRDRMASDSSEWIQDRAIQE